MVRTHVILSLLSLSAVAACHLYFEEDDGGETTPDPDTDGGSPTCGNEAAEEGLFRDCFTFEAWDAAGLCDLAVMRTQMGTCATCHASGGDGVQLNRDCALTFAGMKGVTENFEDLQLARLDESTGCIAGYDVGKVCSSALISETHPPFVCPNNLRDALQQFLDENYQTCVVGQPTP